MPSTVTVQQMINFARTHIKLQPLVNLGGFADQPALAIANDVKSAIVTDAMYNWDWNRASLPPFLTVNKIDQYPLLATDIGWLERGYAERYADTTDPKARIPLEVKRNLQRGDHVDEPFQIAVDKTYYGMDVIRFVPIPTTTRWQCFIDYQRAPRKITQLTSGTDGNGTFWPIPDTMERVIRQFFLAYCYRAVDKQTYYAELAEAHRRLGVYTATQDIEPSDTGVYPERSIVLG